MPRSMSRYSKALSVTVATWLLVLLVWNFAVHWQRHGPEREDAKTQTISAQRQAVAWSAGHDQGTVATQVAQHPVTEAAGTSVQSAALTYSWHEEPGIAGGVRVKRQAADHVTSFVGTHLLAKLRPGVTVDAVQRYLAQAGLGAVIEERGGLLKVAPAALTLSSFMFLQSALDTDEEGLFLYSEPDYIYQTAIVPNDPGLNDELSWHFESIQAFEGWDIRRSAAAIVVAVLDTGLTHTSGEFAGNIWSNNGQVGYDFVNGDSLPEDESGHGTAVAGLIGARANNGIGSAGVAWEVKLMPVKVLNSYGFGITSDIAAGIDFATTNGARIINLSLGGEGKSKALEEAVVRAGAAGVALVSAAGNEGLSLSDYPLYPAAYDFPHNVQVGASAATGQRAYFSNFSEQLVDIFAPGQQIGHVVIADNGQVSLAHGDGTSFAAPLVSGALALIMAQYPDEPLNRSIERLLDAGRFTPSLMGTGKRATQLDLTRALTGFVPGLPTVAWPQDTVALQYGDDFTLAPLITTDSTYTLRWFHNEGFLATSMEPLRFAPFEPQHGGAYRVEISSVEGTTLSPPIILEGIERPPVILSLTPSMVVFAGTTATIEVRLDGIRVRPTVITWYDGITHEKLAEGSHSLQLFVTEPRSVYAHIQSPYGQVTSDIIEIDLADFDWLELLATEVVDSVPLALELDGPLAFNPAYWEIAVPSGSQFLMDDSHGAYFIEGQRICRYDLQGATFCSYILDTSGDPKVVGGFVFLLDGHRLKAILDRQLQLVNAPDDGMQVLDIAFNEGYFYILFRNPVDKQVGIRVTAGFSGNDTVYANLAIVEDDVLPICRLFMADGAGIVELPHRYLWTPGEALQPTDHYSFNWQHNGILYRNENQEITYYDTVSRTWRYAAEDSTANRLRLGFGSVYKEGSSYVSNLGKLRQVFDGEHWRPVGYTAQYSTIRYPDASLRLIGATAEHFYAYQPSDPERPSTEILFSADGFLWESTGYATAHGHLAVIRDQQLVVMEREETVWMDNEQLQRRPIHFPEGIPAGEWLQLKAFGNVAFLEVVSPSAEWAVYVSEDLATWHQTNLSRIPTAFNTQPTAAYLALSDERIMASADLREWQPAQDLNAQALQPIHAFSLGYIRNGYEYSEDGEAWLALPFSTQQVVENKNRIFFIDHYGSMVKFLSKVPFVDELVHPEVVPVVIARRGGTYLGQAAELWIGPSLPSGQENLQVDLSHNGRFLERVTSYPAYIRIADLEPGNNTIRYQLVSSNPSHSGVLASFNAGSTNLNSMQMEAVPWKTGWLSYASSLLYYSEDLYSWERLPDYVPLGISGNGFLPPGNIRGVQSINGHIILEFWPVGARTEAFYLSTDDGATWVLSENPRYRRIIEVIDQQYALVNENGSLYFTEDMEALYWIAEYNGSSIPGLLSGEAYYFLSNRELYRFDLLTKERVLLEQDVRGLGREAYLKLSEDNSRLFLHQLSTGLHIADFAYDTAWSPPEHFFSSQVSLKDDYLFLNPSTPIGGSITDGILATVDTNIRHYPFLPAAMIGTMGVNISAVTRIEWGMAEAPFTRVHATLANAHYLPLASTEGVRWVLEWIEPDTGNVLHRAEQIMYRGIQPQTHENILLEFPAPAFSTRQTLTVRLTLSSAQPYALQGTHTVEFPAIEVNPEVQLSIEVEGAGTVRLLRPGPFRVGATVEAEAVANEGYQLAYWEQPALSKGRRQLINMKPQTKLKVTFLPDAVAAIDSFARHAFQGTSTWFLDRSDRPVFFYGQGWAYGLPSGWTWSEHSDERGLYAWSETFGWTYRRPEWDPFLWSYTFSEWVEAN